ncbi:MAG TPA: ABC transporter transmembrane domain-containing protein [bacterium]|nr:ABC transporter transmembrane domain-containing protein [bacterium]
MTDAPPKTPAFRLYRKYLSKLRPYSFPIGVGIASDLYATFLAMIPPLFSILLFDYAYPGRDLRLLTWVVAAGLVLYFINFFFSSINDYMNVFVDEKISTSLSLDMFRKIMHLPLLSPASKNVGDTTVRILEDADLTAGMLLNAPQALLINLANLGLFLVISLMLNPYVTLLSLASIPFYLLETEFFSGRLSELREETQKNRSETYDGLQERLLSLRTVKAFCREDHEALRFKIYLDRRIKLNIKQKIIGIISAFSNSFTLQIWSTFVAWYMGYQVVHGHLTLGQLLALSAYLPQIAGPIHELANLYTNFRVGMVSLRRVDEILSLPSEWDEAFAKEPLALERGKIDVQSLSFRYDELSQTLRKITFEVPEGSSLALVGGSGAGKSTIINLLLRFYDPSEGMIYFDGQTVGRAQIDALRGRMGAVFQEISLFAGTIRENILYGNPSASDEEMREAAQMAAAHDFIDALPLKYDSPVEHFGQNFSGGQRQRLAIARALAMKPKILVLDEASSALDAESEFLIQETIHRCKGKMTVVIVAHRFSSIKGVDKIVVLDRGTVAESGTFPQLMAKKGVFFTLYQLQMGGFQEFQQRMETEFARYQRYRQDLSVILLDVSNYDQLAQNEKAGRLARLMEELNLFLRKNLRIMDFCCVFRERELLIGLPETNFQNSVRLARRLRQKIAEQVFEVDEKGFKLDVVPKVASCREDFVRYPDELIEKAEEAPTDEGMADPDQTIREEKS